MNNDKKILMQQKRIEELEKMNQKLKKENIYLNNLKKVFFDAGSIKEIQTMKKHYETVLEDVLKIKEQYISAVKEMSDLKKKYQSEMESQLKRIKKQA